MPKYRFQFVHGGERKTGMVDASNEQRAQGEMALYLAKSPGAQFVEGSLKKAVPLPPSATPLRLGYLMLIDLNAN